MPGPGLDDFECHAKNKIAGRMIPFLVLGLLDKITGYAPAPCHVAGIVRHYQDLGMSSLKKHDYACNSMLSVV